MRLRTMGPDETEVPANINVSNVIPNNAENSESRTFFYDIQPFIYFL